MNRKKDEKGAVRLIRNSTAEFLIFTGQAGEQSIDTRYEDETIWLSQKLMAELFAVGVPTINEHIKNTYETGELPHEATIRKFRIVQNEGAEAFPGRWIFTIWTRSFPWATQNPHDYGRLGQAAG